MLEREVEKKLVDGVRRMGGRAYKFVSPGNDGVPDRIVVLPDTAPMFVEKLGQNVRVLYGAKDVENFLEEMWNEI